MTSAQITKSKIAKIIFEQALEDPNVLGEALLKYSFVGEGRGCYNNFELRPSFRLFSSGKNGFADHFLGEGDLYDTYEYSQEIDRISSYLDAEIELAVAWLWDGDGHLIFQLGEVMLENTDIKKSNNWRFIDEN